MDYLSAMLVYGHKLDHGCFHIAAMIGDVILNFTTHGRFIVV